MNNKFYYTFFELINFFEKLRNKKIIFLNLKILKYIGNRLKYENASAFNSLKVLLSHRFWDDFKCLLNYIYIFKQIYIKVIYIKYIIHHIEI